MENGIVKVGPRIWPAKNGIPRGMVDFEGIGETRSRRFRIRAAYGTMRNFGTTRRNS